MLQDVVSSHDQLSIDDITSPLSAQIFDFCDSQLFQETVQVSEVTSDENSALFSNNNNILEKSGSFQENTGEISNSNNKILQDVEDNNNNNNNTDLSIIFDSPEDFETDIAASIDFSSSSLQYPVIDHLLTVTNQDQFDFSGVQSVHHQAPNNLYSGDSLALPGVFEEDCLSSVPSYNVGFNSSSPSCSFFRTPGLPAYMAGNMSTGLASESSVFFPGNVHLGSEIKPHDQLMDFQGDNGGLFCTDSIKRIFNPGDIQGFGGGENQTHMVTQQAPPPALGAAEVTGLEDSAFSKVGKLSVEQRKEKIHRYMKKRNQRNFSKKIKYACRKTLADSRPRVRGRFAKNDEFGEPNRQISLSHHDDEEEDDIGVKEEDSSDIFSHISGANSFRCNYSIQSWI